MPKVKNHSGAKKRFSITNSGKVKCKHANKRHNLRKRSTKLKRSLTGTMIMADVDVVHVVNLLNLPAPRYRKKRAQLQAATVNA
jgi:large subunit ribosomal protein L35